MAGSGRVAVVGLRGTGRYSRVIVDEMNDWQEHVVREILRLAAPDRPELRGYVVQSWRGEGPPIDRHCLCNAIAGEIVNGK